MSIWQIVALALVADFAFCVFLGRAIALGNASRSAPAPVRARSVVDDLYRLPSRV